MDKSVVVVCLMVVFAAGGASAECDVGWVAIQDGCYALLQNATANWADARTHCGFLAADLAIVDDVDVLRGIYEYIVAYQLQGSFWLGGTDAVAEDDWLWVDSVRVDLGIPFWALHNNLLGWSLEPQGGTDENCLALPDDRFYFMDDRDCNEQYYPICQIASIAISI